MSINRDDEDNPWATIMIIDPIIPRDEKVMVAAKIKLIWATEE